LKSIELIVKENMKVEIEVTTTPRVILISGGRAREIDVPHHGEIIVKTCQGRIAKFETMKGELF
jgi:hypothetical protein